MSDDYKAVCEKLDDLTISYLSKIDDYAEQRKNCSSLFQKGFVDLAHAKYAMGTRIISHNSYDRRMKASLNLEIDNNEKIHIVKAGTAKESKKAIEEEGLRKRNKQSKGADKNDSKIAEKDVEKTTKKNDKKGAVNKDPLHWFGLFVSPSLRSSQNSFSMVIEKLIDQANTVGELEAMEKKYRELLKEKQVLKETLEYE